MISIPFFIWLKNVGRKSLHIKQMMYTVIFPIILFNKPAQTWSYLTVGIFSLYNDNIKQQILNTSRRNVYEIPLCYNENQKTLEVLTCFNVVFLFHGFLVITVVSITIHHSLFTVHRSPFTIHLSPFTIHHSTFTEFYLSPCITTRSKSCNIFNL